jgi:CarD family transcriptional regulator
MPSTRKTVRSRKAAVSAKSRGASPKTAKATGAKTGGGRRAEAQAAQSKTAASTARTKAAARAKSARTTKTTAKDAAKTDARTTSKTTAAAKSSSAKRSVAKRAAAAPVRRQSAGHDVIKRAEVAPRKCETVPPKAAIAPTPTRKPAAAPKVAAKKSAASTSAKVAIVKPIDRLTSDLTAQEARASTPPVAEPRVSVTPTASIPPAASEQNQVRQNLSQPASKPASALAANAQSHARAAVPARTAPVGQKPAAGAKSRAPNHKLGFKAGEFIVYPAHGVGQIIGIEVQEVAGFSLELFVINFIKDKMILKVPTSKAPAVGMRKLSEADVVEKALGTLSGRARIKRTMWSRRAQEYEAKINSGDLVTIAEVVRDLYRSDTQPEQSYSERQLYEAALDRMAREIAAVRKLLDQEALTLIESFLAKAPRRSPKGEGDTGDEADVERAA